MTRTMTRWTAVAAILAATLAVTTGVAAAAEIEVVPDAVATEGEAELEITLTGFEPEVTVFVLPCAPPEGEMTTIDDVDATTCATNEVASARTDADGAATITAEWTVPAEGLAIVAGNESRTDSAVVLVTVGDTAVLGNAQENDDGDPAPTDDELAETGSETVVLLTVGAGLVFAGMASRGVARRRVVA